MKLNTAVETKIEKLKCKLLLLMCKMCIKCVVCGHNGFVSAFKINLYQYMT